MRLRDTPCLIILLIAAAAISSTAYAEGPTVYRSCVVQEHFDNGGYTYLRCRERGSDIWLAVMQTTLSRGETVTFPDAPPMINFSSKSMKRTFDKIIFAPGLSRRGSSAAASPAPATEAPAYARDDTTTQGETNIDRTYAGEDDNGTLVFTDDPSKVRKSAKVKRRVKKIENTTVRGTFSAQEQKLVAMLEKALNAYCTYDTQGLKSITSAQYWPALWNGLQNEGSDKGASFLRKFCFDTFRADTVKHFREQSQADGATYSFADLTFTASRFAKGGEPDDDLACTASFIKEQPGWKYLDILCGAERVSYPAVSP